MGHSLSVRYRCFSHCTTCDSASLTLQLFRYICLKLTPKGASPRERNVFLLAVGDYCLIDEFSTVVSINSQDRERKQCPRSLDSCQHGLLTPVQEGQTFRPAGCYIGERQGVQVPSLNISTTMGHQIRWKSSRVGPHSTPRRCGWESAASGVFPLASWRGHADLVCAENASLRSAVAALMERSWLRHSSVRCSCRSSASTKVGRKGIRRLAQMRLAACQARNSACWTSGPYCRGRGLCSVCCTSSAWLSSHLA